MRYGVTLFATDVSMGIVELARATEERGLDSLWLPEHTHIPLSRRTPPPTGGDVLAEEYKRALDPLVALAAAASVTNRLRLGTGILLAPYDQRRSITRDHVRAMQALWADDEAAYAGDHVSFSSSWSWPKPVQRDGAGRPAVPVLVGGGAGPKLFAHIAEYAAGWIPIGGAGLTEALPLLLETVAAAGRDPSTLEVVPFGSFPSQGKLDHFTEIGVTECVFRLPSAPRDEVLPVLDRYADLLTQRGDR